MSKSLIIFDWDDTLFPTSWYSQVKTGRINATDQIKKNTMMFNELDYIVADVLKEYMKHGKVVIVTNAADRWVRMVMDVMPQTAKLLYKQIEVVSARDLYADKFPDDVFKWKQLIFQDLFRNYFKPSLTKGPGFHNVVSIGDAEYEFESLKKLHGYPVDTNGIRLLKNIKFAPRPSHKDVKEQLVILAKSAQQIINRKKHMDLEMKTLQ